MTLPGDGPESSQSINHPGIVGPHSSPNAGAKTCQRVLAEDSDIGIPHVIAVHSYYFFKKNQVYGNPASSKSTSTAFPIAFAHFISLCHILTILNNISNIFIIICILWQYIISEI